MTYAAASVLAQKPQATDTPPANANARLEQPKQPPETPARPAMTPFVHSVRDVELGMSVDEVKKKLGRPDVEDDTGLLFSLSGGDSVQVGLDENKKVRTIADIYAAGSKSAPSIKDIFGPAAEDSGGDTYKMERYPDAGYWVSYSRSNSSDKPIVVVMMRRIT